MDLFDSLYEAGVETVKENTTSDAVAYIPGGFGNVSKVIRPLSRKKKSWKLKLYSNPLKERYELDMEGKRITVPHHVWRSFENDLKTLGYVTVQDKEHFFNFSDELLSESILETEKVKEDRVQEVREGLDKLLKNKLVKECLETSSFWLEFFGGVRLNTPKAVLSYDYKNTIPSMLSGLKTTTDSGFGDMESLITALDSQISLKNAPIFKDNLWVVGVTTLSRYLGVELKFEARVDLNFVPSQKVTVTTANEELFEELRGYKNINVVGNEIYPKEKSFETSFFVKLKKEIKDLED